MMFNQQLQMAYNQLAERYAEANAAMPEAVIAAANQFLQMFPSASHILDVGCGHGRDAAWFEAHGYAVANADLSLGMLAQARRIVQGPLIQADMQTLPFQDATFDGLWCDAVLLHLPKRDAPRALEEFRRVLKSGGALFVSLQYGEGEVWESISYGQNAPRFFARYAVEEAAALIIGSDFIIHHQNSSHRWLHFFARKV
jgi:ubiquinone/menaquinone biosynthesis C-methylase UbiE